MFKKPGMLHGCASNCIGSLTWKYWNIRHRYIIRILVASLTMNPNLGGMFISYCSSSILLQSFQNCFLCEIIICISCNAVLSTISMVRLWLATMILWVLDQIDRLLMSSELRQSEISKMSIKTSKLWLLYTCCNKERM